MSEKQLDFLVACDRKCIHYLKTSFSYTSQNVKKYVYFGLFGGPEGVFNDQTGPILITFQLSSDPYLCTCQIRKQSDF